MFDVIHTIYEEDVTPQFEHHAEVKDKVRSAIYELLYQRKYRYAGTDTREPSMISDMPVSEMPDLPDLPPEMKPVKPYFPPTDVGDLQKILDAPLS